MAVMRTPTEMLIDLIYILQEKTAERMEKFRSYEDIANLKFAMGISLLHDGKVDSLAMRALEVKADAARRLYGTKPDGGLRKIRDWADNSIDARATAIGLAPIYGTTYRDACAAGHSGAATLRYVIEVDDAGTHFRWGPGLPSPKPVALALYAFFGLLGSPSTTSTSRRCAPRSISSKPPCSLERARRTASLRSVPPRYAVSSKLSYVRTIDSMTTSSEALSHTPATNLVGHAL